MAPWNSLTPEHVRAAWSYINHKDNAAKYQADEVAQIKGRIKRAAEKHGVEINED
jgi:type III secretion system FlhB-like substrate exporter